MIAVMQRDYAHITFEHLLQSQETGNIMKLSLKIGDSMSTKLLQVLKKCQICALIHNCMEVRPHYHIFSSKAAEPMEAKFWCGASIMDRGDDTNVHGHMTKMTTDLW